MENPVVAGVLVALIVPFLGNTLGAALVFLMRHGMSERFTKALLGFAAGVMIAASVWSLITPALEAAEGGPVRRGRRLPWAFSAACCCFWPSTTSRRICTWGSDEPEGARSPR